MDKIDYLLALTKVDEVNLVAAKSAYEMGAKRIGRKKAKKRPQSQSRRQRIAKKKSKKMKTSKNIPEMKGLK